MRRGSGLVSRDRERGTGVGRNSRGKNGDQRTALISLETSPRP